MGLAITEFAGLFRVLQQYYAIPINGRAKVCPNYFIGAMASITNQISLKHLEKVMKREVALHVLEPTLGEANDSV